MQNNGSKVGCWIAIGVLALMLFGSFLTNIGLVATLFAGSSAAGNDYPVDEEPVFEEIWSYGYGDTKVVRIDLAGVIMRGRRERLFGSEPDMVETILGQIRSATLDPDVKAILLEVDSPGGAVTPSDEIYASLEQFKSEDEERMVMVFVRDLGASGAYYAAMAGDYIMVEPTAIVGSVGVIMQTLNMKGLGDKIGLSSVTIASGANKDMLNPFKEVNPQHVAMLQELVDGMQERFASIVENSRGLENRDLLDGRVFSASQALEHNLIDGVGYLQDAIDTLEELLDLDGIYMVRYYEKRGFWDSLMESKLPALPDFTAMEGPRFLYLWKP
ncbi:signal peptide peptidase SppA [Pontiella sulfatireligans]|uniref:Signal peptide peptidase SppA n=1 Tax=Pontiella sulfatireligans TaxID=2750658 RepID=A0A6C2ULE0_9BACT|nr:signal peptide peptidase SppA [Pontiella sulfatireligans]VGO20237.1 Putative signal peptide peptidase SppA [Pontiella sulfatireligans]